MSAGATSLCAFLLLAPESIEMRFEQVAPSAATPRPSCELPMQKRAVVFIHGLLPHPINDAQRDGSQISAAGRNRAARW